MVKYVNLLSHWYKGLAQIFLHYNLLSGGAGCWMGERVQRTMCVEVQRPLSFSHEKSQDLRPPKFLKSEIPSTYLFKAGGTDSRAERKNSLLILALYFNSNELFGFQKSWFAI